jgi:hypothetical protein
MPTVNNRGPFLWASAFGSSPGGATRGAVAAWQPPRFASLAAAGRGGSDGHF